MFAGLYLIGAGMFFAGMFCYEVFKDEDGKGMRIIHWLRSLISFIGLLSFPLITIAYGIKLIINS
jgi:hypothetical protein